MQKINSLAKSSLLVQGKTKFIIFSVETANKFYFRISKNISIKKIKSKLICDKSFFLNQIENVLKNSAFGIKKKLILTGLGFKIWNPSMSDKKISFKLGYSHLVFLKVPVKTIFFHSYKIKRISGMLFITIKGNNVQEVGNFIKKLKNLKKYDVYKGKGFSEKKLKLKLKVFKKK